MDSRETKRDPPQLPWRPTGAGTRAWREHGDRRELPPRPSPPPPPPPPPPPHNAANARRGEGGRAVRARKVEAEGAAAAETGRGVARRQVGATAGPNAAAVVAEHGAHEGTGSAAAAAMATAWEERIVSEGERVKKRSLPSPAPPPSKQKKVRQRWEDRIPAEWVRESATALGRRPDRDARISSRPPVAPRADAGAGASDKAAPPPPPPLAEASSNSRPPVAAADGGAGAPDKAARRPPPLAVAGSSLRPPVAPRADAGAGASDKAARHPPPLAVAGSTSRPPAAPRADGGDGAQDHAARHPPLAVVGSSSRHPVARADAGAGAPDKAARHPHHAVVSSKNAMLRETPPRIAGKSLLKKVPAAVGDARPMPSGNSHGADNKVLVKQSEAPCQSVVAAAGLPDSADRLQRKSNAGSLLGRGTGETPPPFNAVSINGCSGVSKAKGVVIKDDAGSSAANKFVSQLENRRPCHAAAQEEERGKGPSRSPAQGPSQQHRKGKEVVLEIGRMNKVPSDVTSRKSSQSEPGPSRLPFGPKKKGKVEARDGPKIIPVPLGSKEELDCTGAYILEDDDVLKAIAICEEGLKLYYIKCYVQRGVKNTDARSKFKMICRRFEFICKVLGQPEAQHLLIHDRGRIDIVARKVMKQLPPGFSIASPIVGKVPGTEIGDKFRYRLELFIVGLHSKCRGGIGWINRNGSPIATCIVCSSGYPDQVSSSGELIYTGSGGKPAGREHDEDQKLKGGNRALKNCFEAKSPVRVIYGFNSDNAQGGDHSRAKQILTYTYDGLYHVVGYKKEKEQGSMMYKYRLKRIPGQPELSPSIVKQIRQSKVR